MKIAAAEEPADAGRAAALGRRARPSTSSSTPTSSILRAARRSTSTRRPTTASASSSRCRRTAARTARRTSTTWRPASRLGDEIPGVNYPTGGRQRRVGARRTRLLLHALSAGRRAPGRGPPLLSSRSTFTGSARRRRSDRYVIGRDFPRIAEIELEGRAATAATCSPRCATATAARSPTTCADRDGRWHAGRRLHRRRQAARVRRRRQALRHERQGRAARPHHRDSAAQRRRSPTRRVVVPETNIVAENVQPTRSRLYVTYRDGGPSVVRMYSLDGKLLGELATPTRCPTSRCRRALERRRRAGDAR